MGVDNVKGDNNLKILYTVELLYKKSDEETYITATDIMNYLKEKYELSVDRKTIYNYINLLIDVYGMDIKKEKRGYRLMSRLFDLAELKMLADALSSSRFISQEKTRTIIKKLGKLTTQDKASELYREVFVENAVKSDNHFVIYNIDHIHNAINENKRITFKYFGYEVDFSDENKNKIKKKYRTYSDGENKGDIKIYEQSPIALVWKNENYYMLSYDNVKKKVLTFRVDKMEDTNVSDKKRAVSDIYDEIDVAEYANTAFSMFSGEKIHIEMRARNNLLPVVLDRFGSHINIYKIDDDNFGFFTDVQQSDMFFSWISGFGDEIELLSPKKLRNDYKEYISKIMKMYE